MSATIENKGRQYELTALQTVTFEDFKVGVPPTLRTRLPVNAIVTGGAVIVSKPWVGGTVTLDLGTTADPALFVAGVSFAAEGYTPFEGMGIMDTDGKDVLYTPTVAGAATAGEAHIIVKYIILNRAHEVQTT